MQQWMGEERAFAVKAYYQNGEFGASSARIPQSFQRSA
jgi:hypothetical protein